jgi:hypothetical protein
MVQLVAAAFPDRHIDVVGDAAYSSPALRTLPEQVSWTLRLRRNARLDGPTPPRTGRRGRPRLRGNRLGSPAELAEHAVFTPTEVRRDGLRGQTRLAVVDCLWFEPFHIRPCRVVLLRDPGTAAGYDLAVLTTDLTSPAEAIVARYAARWGIEVAIFDAKQVTGAGQARNRLRRAVERTVPFALLTQALVVLWYADHGDPAGDLDAARAAAPWYTTKAEPCYADMHAALRRTIIAVRFSPDTAGPPTDDEIRAVLTAWAAAEPAPAA